MRDLRYNCLRIRRVEEAVCREYWTLTMRCPVHISIGEEQIAVGVCSNLRKTDKVFSSHRSHAHYIAKGGNLKRFIAELHGKATGCCGGVGGSMHLQDPECGFIASTSIVASSIPLAVGSAWADKLLGRDNVTVCFFGDGAMEEGVAHESMNFSSLHRLPILFVCSNNGLAVTTELKDRQANRGLSNLAAAHGLVHEFCMSSDIDYISKIAGEAIERARQGKPQFIEFVTERERTHVGIDHEYELTADCLAGYNTDETEIHREIAEAFEYARNSPVPTNSDIGVFAK